MAKVRIALVQIAFQPALAINHVAYLEEPLPPPQKQAQSYSLSGLAARGLNVHSMQAHCRARYIEWMRSRLDPILSHLASMHPAPDLVVFPEASIPLDLLPRIAEWVREHGTTVIAGSHTPQVHGAGRQLYADAGVTRNDIQAIASWNCENVLPIVQADRTRVYPKTDLSVHELADVAQPASAKRARRSITIDTSDGARVSVLPVICSEALIDNGTMPKSDLIAVVSCEDTPSRFLPWIQTQVAKRRSVLYCNSAHAGGTAAAIATDLRHPNWFLETMASGLPPGEGILVADIDTEVTAVETGTAKPGNAFELVALAGIQCADARQIADARELLDTCAEVDPDARARRLAGLLARLPSESLLAVRARRLQFDASRGQPDADVLAALGKECFTDGPSLPEVQRELTTACAERLPMLIPSAPAGDGEALRVLSSVMVHYNKHRGPTAPMIAEPRTESRGFVDREEERTRLRDFIDSKESVVVMVSGLPGVGKSALVANGLDQLGISDLTWLTLDEATSAEYVFRKISGSLSGVVPTFAAALEERFARAIRRGQIIVLDGSRLSHDYDRWAEPDLEQTVVALVRAASDKGAKIVVETQQRLSATLDGLPHSERLFLHGLDRKKSKYGLQILESQLRRMSLPADMLSQQAKERLVALLSGNPKALELAATACLDQGADAVLKSLDRGAGAFPDQIRKLLRVTRYSAVERDALVLLSRARADVPRGTITAALGATAAEPLRSLIVSGAVEIREGGLIGIANIMRSYFAAETVDDGVEKRFHEAASRALEGAGDHELERRTAAEYHARMAGIAVTKPVGSLPDSALAAALRLYDAQQYARAAHLLDEIISVRPRWRPALRLGALTYARVRERGKALTYAKSAFVADKKDPRLYRELTSIGLSQNDELLLEGLIDIGEEVGLNETDVLSLRGRLHLRRKQLRLAEGAFQRASEVARDAWPFVFLGETYLRMGRTEDALEVFHEGEDKHTKYRWVNRNGLYAIQTKLGLTYLLLGDLETAESWIGSADDNDRSPDSARAHALLELLKERAVNLDRILDRMKLAKARNRHDRSIIHQYAAEILLHHEHCEEAEHEYERAVEQDHGNVFAWVRWAQCALELARMRRALHDSTARAFAERAHAAVRQVLSVDPGHPIAVSIAHTLHLEFPELAAA